MRTEAIYPYQRYLKSSEASAAVASARASYASARSGASAAASVRSASASSPQRASCWQLAMPVRSACTQELICGFAPYRALKGVP